MKRIITFSIIVFSCIASFKVNAQQLPFFSQYMFNHYILNPAAAGSKTQMPIMLGYRNQWSGLANTPTTINISAHTPIGNKIGLGAMLYNDKTGPTSSSSMQLSYAYHMRSGIKDLKLSFGLSGLLYQNSIDHSALITNDIDDPAILENKQRTFNPNASFGTYLYNGNFFFGYSIPTLFEVKMGNSTNPVFENRMFRHHFLSTGYKFTLNEEYELEPSVLYKKSKNIPAQLDINTKLIYKQTMWLGVSYRTSKSIVSMIGVTKNKISVGYSFDMALSSIRSYSSGSHEFFIGINLTRINTNKGTETGPQLGPTPIYQQLNEDNPQEISPEDDIDDEEIQVDDE